MSTAEPVALLEHIQSILSSLEFSRSWNMPPLPWSRRTGECGILVANLPCSTTANFASSYGALVPPEGVLLSRPPAFLLSVDTENAHRHFPL